WRESTARHRGGGIWRWPAARGTCGVRVVLADLRLRWRKGATLAGSPENLGRVPGAALDRPWRSSLCPRLLHCSPAGCLLRSDVIPCRPLRFQREIREDFAGAG